MSNIFIRPNPKNAKSKDVLKALDDIIKWDWTTGFSFAHSVIDDQNLSDNDILYSLRPDIINEVMQQKLKDAGLSMDFSNLGAFERIEYIRLIEHMAEVVDLLNWLLNVPVEQREDV